MRKPANIDTLQTQLFLIDATALEHVGYYLMLLLEDGWRVYIVKQNRGRCYYHNKVITIPTWAINDNRPGYWIYYLCHEMAHAFDVTRSIHGAGFMQEFKRICPEEFQCYEYRYKPRNANVAGVANKKPTKSDHVQVTTIDDLFDLL